MPLDRSDSWKAYELSQRHYEGELTLFGTRMSLFLVVHSALIAFVTSQGSSPRVVTAQIWLPLFGFLLAIAWLVVAVGSYRWLKMWRRRLRYMAASWDENLGAEPSMTLFEDRKKAVSDHHVGKIFDSIFWYVRPTFVMCCVPALFSVAWLALIIT